MALSRCAALKAESRLAGSSGRFLLPLCVSLSLMASLCLGGLCCRPWFLCPAQASFCGDHDEYSGRVLEALVMKKEPFVVHCCFLPWNYPLCLRRRGILGPGPGGQVSSREILFCSSSPSTPPAPGPCQLTAVGPWVVSFIHSSEAWRPVPVHTQETAALSD